MTSPLSVENLDHLGIVAGLIDDIGIVEHVDFECAQALGEAGHGRVGVAGEPQPQVVGQVPRQLHGLKSHL